MELLSIKPFTKDIGGNVMTYINEDILTQIASYTKKEVSQASEPKKSDFRMLQAIGDTFPTMNWLYFKDVLQRNGFVEALRYQISSILDDEFVLYIHVEKGLLVWADSYGGIIRNGALYGQLQHQTPSPKNPIQFVQLDVRMGLINKLHHLSNEWTFLPIWKENQFLWLLDYNEEDGFRPYKEIALDKILRSSKELQTIVFPCLQDLQS